MIDFLYAGFLYLARLTPLFLMPSLLPIAKLPSIVKIILSIGIALLMATVMPVGFSLSELSMVQLLLVGGQEFLIGIGLIFGIQITLAAVSFAGKIVDLQLGFGVASVLDPMTDNQESLIGVLLSTLFTVAFFTLDMHHVLVKGIANTFEYFPVASSLIVPSIGKMISFFSAQFVLGLLVVMPVMLGMFLLDTMIAFVSRTMPQVNVYFVSLPLKIFVGLFILSVSLRFMAGHVENIFAQSIYTWFDSFEVYR